MADDAALEESDGYEPTHVLLAPAPFTRDRRFDRQVREAVAAGARVADRVRVYVDERELVGHTPVLEDMRRIRDDDEPDAVFETGASSTAVQALSAVEVDRTAPIRAIRLQRDGATVLQYTLAFRELTAVDERGLVGILRDRFTDVPAAMFETSPLASWTTGGIECAVRPPSLIVGDGAHELRDLAAIDADDDAQRIELTWYDDGENALVRALYWLVDLIGGTRPTALEFDSPESYREARDALESVVEVTGAWQGGGEASRRG